MVKLPFWAFFTYRFYRSDENEKVLDVRFTGLYKPYVPNKPSTKGYKMMSEIYENAEMIIEETIDYDIFEPIADQSIIDSFNARMREVA